MQLFFVILTIVALIATLLSGILISNNAYYKIFVLIIFQGISLILFGFSITFNNISPIDVYRGKTELKITKTIVNDQLIYCDSVVVLKN